MIRVSRQAAVLGTVATGRPASPGRRSPRAVDFSGRTIEWVISFAEGGGSDVWARFLAPSPAKQQPGRPNVMIRKVPGGGSITGANAFFLNTNNDGSTFAGASGSRQFAYLPGDAWVRCDDAQMPPVLVSPTSGVLDLPTRHGVRHPPRSASSRAGSWSTQARARPCSIWCRFSPSGSKG